MMDDMLPVIYQQHIAPVGEDYIIAEAVHQVWKDPIIPRVMDGHSSDLYLMDSAGYFFGQALRIGSPMIPTERNRRASRITEDLWDQRDEVYDEPAIQAHIQ
ncbi:hypothetical protein BDQ12DRAFT_500607 [Crucibulum laeve]|uniref:Uncharacterized protein n=1 Tax=Crucibulum laeve TaxID=68775 RepID=A0A5C3LKV2_9AGAR|nr:hypothetical protein BDQ12DRAFT_500607 [Crucibulum laeve]